jgi:hypothetical protein
MLDDDGDGYLHDPAGVWENMTAKLLTKLQMAVKSLVELC